MRNVLVALAALGASFTARAGMEDDPLLATIFVDKLEYRAGGESSFVWDTDLWIGKDLNKLWLKTAGEVADGTVEDADVQVLYSRAIAPYWDVQGGWRHDFGTETDRDWFTVRLQGLAPYFFEVDTGLFVGDRGNIGFDFEAEYEILFTQRLILSPLVELSAYSLTDEAMGRGSGLSDLELGLRLRYEFRREFAPYIGVNWFKLFGGTADFTEEEGGDTDGFQFLVGLRAWY
ncbi:MAG TPA: copper resistance protein B [Chromatiales bacterium]|nr:copper resistance protein B [Chromatiales bacterium]